MPGRSIGPGVLVLRRRTDKANFIKTILEIIVYMYINVVFLSTENIILTPIFTLSNIKSLFCLYNNSDEEIIYEWKKYDFFI